MHTALELAARDYLWEPETWEAYQASKESNSVAWNPEFLSLGDAVETTFGPPPTDFTADVSTRLARRRLNRRK